MQYIIYYRYKNKIVPGICDAKKKLIVGRDMLRG